tara:strand:+ start:421 stop:561 length:141 start_codon:yes stop_codon:yes gene_type:complete
MFIVFAPSNFNFIVSDTCPIMFGLHFSFHFKKGFGGIFTQDFFYIA